MSDYNDPYQTFAHKISFGRRPFPIISQNCLCLYTAIKMEWPASAPGGAHAYARARTRSSVCVAALIMRSTAFCPLLVQSSKQDDGPSVLVRGGLAGSLVQSQGHRGHQWHHLCQQRVYTLHQREGSRDGSLCRSQRLQRVIHSGEREEHNLCYRRKGLGTGGKRWTGIRWAVCGEWMDQSYI